MRRFRTNIRPPAGHRRQGLKTAGVLLLLSVYLAYVMEMIYSRSFYINVSWGFFLFSVAAALMLTALFLAVTGRLGLAYVFAFVVAFAFSCVSFFKLVARGDPLYLSELVVARWIMGVVDGSNIVVTRFIVISLLSACAIGAGLFFLKLCVGWRGRIVSLLVALVIAVCILFWPGIFSAAGGEPGVVAAFFLGPPRDDIEPAVIDPAAELGEEDELPMEVKQPEVQPNVIMLLSESFWDITELPLSFTEDPIPNFKRLSKESVHGNILSVTYGGGTCDVEFEAITGYLIRLIESRDKVYQSLGTLYQILGQKQEETHTIAHVFKELGYHTRAVHTHQRTFFNRDQVYPHFGFDAWVGVEDLIDPVYDGTYVSDATLTDEIIKALEEDGPQFVFAISMENHQPYTQDKYPETDIKVLNEDMDKTLKYGVEAYVHGLRHADQQLARLTEYLESSDTPTVLLFFGDHQPNIGSDFALHRYAGTIPAEGKRRTEDLPTLLTTQFLIWSNYKDEVGYVEAIGENFIGNLLLNYLEFPKPRYYYFLDDVYENYFHFVSRTEMYLDENNVYHNGADMPEELRALLGRYSALQRYMMKGDDPTGRMLRELR